MKAGKYYIGDPCYVIDDNWEGFLDVGQARKSEENETFIFGGYECFFASTSDGDGTFKDNLGNEYDVDSGTIGIIPIELLQMTEEYIKENKCGNVVEFDEEFNVKSISGIFTFGHIVINTVKQWTDDKNDYWDMIDDYDDYDNDHDSWEERFTDWDGSPIDNEEEC